MCEKHRIMIHDSRVFQGWTMLGLEVSMWEKFYIHIYICFLNVYAIEQKDKLKRSVRIEIKWFGFNGLRRSLIFLGGRRDTENWWRRTIKSQRWNQWTFEFTESKWFWKALPFDCCLCCNREMSWYDFGWDYVWHCITSDGWMEMIWRFWNWWYS